MLQTGQHMEGSGGSTSNEVQKQWQLVSIYLFVNGIYTRLLNNMYMPFGNCVHVFHRFADITPIQCIYITFVMHVFSSHGYI